MLHSLPPLALHIGRYFLGLGNSFLRFNTTQRSIVFGSGGDSPALSVQVNGGAIRLDVSLQYQLVPREVVQLYQITELSYHTKLVAETKDVIFGVAQKVSSPSDFYSSRAAVQANMLAAVRPALRKLHVEVVDLQLRRVVLPATTQNTILRARIEREVSARDSPLLLLLLLHLHASTTHAHLPAHL